MFSSTLTLTLILSRARFLLLAFWWGAMGAIGAVVVPLLFSVLDDKLLAGGIAAKLFIWMSQLSAFCALLALVCLVWVRVKNAHLLDQKSHQESNLEPHLEPHLEPNHVSTFEDSKAFAFNLLWSGLALLVSLGMLFLIIPKIQLGEHRALWHGLGSGAYGILWILSGVLLIKDAKRCFASSKGSPLGHWSP